MKINSIDTGFFKGITSGVNSIFLELGDDGLEFTIKDLSKKVEGINNIVITHNIFEEHKELSKLIKKYNKVKSDGKIFIIINGEYKPKKITGLNIEYICLLDYNSKYVDEYIELGCKFLLLARTEDEFDKVNLFVTDKGINKMNIYAIIDNNKLYAEIKIKGYNITMFPFWMID